MTKKVVVAITGASGSVYAVRLIEELKRSDAEIHLIISEWGRKTLEWETGIDAEELMAKADHVYDNSDMFAPVASGSYPIDAVIVVPCSMKTVAAISCGYADTLISRVCDVAVKEQRKLIIVPREAPLSAIHLENLLKLSRLGVVIDPMMPVFYTRPQSLDDLIDETVGRLLRKIGIHTEIMHQWQGIETLKKGEKK